MVLLPDVVFGPLLVVLFVGLVGLDVDGVVRVIAVDSGVLLVDVVGLLVGVVLVPVRVDDDGVVEVVGFVVGHFGPGQSGLSLPSPSPSPSPSLSFFPSPSVFFPSFIGPFPW